MTRAKGELTLLVLGALASGESDSATIARGIGDSVNGRRKVEITLQRLADRGLVHRMGTLWALTMAGRGYVQQLRAVLTPAPPQEEGAPDG